MSVKTIACASVTGAMMMFCHLADAEPIKDEPAPKKLEWRHERFRTSEYIVTGALVSGLVATQLVKPKDDDLATWRGPILMDGSVASALRPSSPEARDRAALASDYLLYGMILYPFLDAGYAASVRKSPDVAWQMSLINAQAFAFTGLMTFGIKTLTHRERPLSAACEPGDLSCKTSDSFLSGHSSMAFTSAGLTCAHHQALHLYGNPVADIGACAVSLAAATATGTLRILADKHYASDVLAGAALGIVSGYVFPMLLHYGGGSGSSGDAAKRKDPKQEKSFAWTVSPTPMRGGGGLSFTGVF